MPPSAFRIEEVHTLYTVGRDQNQDVRELLIMNYDPPTNLLGLC